MISPFVLFHFLLFHFFDVVADFDFDDFAIFLGNLLDVFRFANHDKLQFVFWKIFGDNLVGFCQVKTIHVFFEIVYERFVQIVPKHLRQQAGQLFRCFHNPAETVL